MTWLIWVAVAVWVFITLCAIACAREASKQWPPGPERFRNDKGGSEA